MHSIYIYTACPRGAFCEMRSLKRNIYMWLVWPLNSFKRLDGDIININMTKQVPHHQGPAKSQWNVFVACVTNFLMTLNITGAKLIVFRLKSRLLWVNQKGNNATSEMPTRTACKWLKLSLLTLTTAWKQEKNHFSNTAVTELGTSASFANGSTASVSRNENSHICISTCTQI